MTDLLPVPKVPIPDTSAYRDHLRQTAHDIGLEIIKDRTFRHDFRPLGVHVWVEKVKQAGVQSDESTIRRRMNELADPRFWTLRPWILLSVKFKDMLPSSSYRLVESLQSSYLPSPFCFPDLEEYCLRSVNMGLIQFLDFVSAKPEVVTSP